MIGKLIIIKFSIKWFSVFIKQVTKGLLPMVPEKWAKSVTPIPKQQEIKIYLNIFLKGLKIPSIGFELILLKLLNKKFIIKNSKLIMNI